MTDEQFSELPDVEVVEGEVVDESDGEGVAPSPTPGDLGIELPEDPDQAVEVLTGHIAEARTTAEAHLDDLRRIAAEYDNFRKRSLRDREMLVAHAGERIVSSMLPVLDSFDAALTIEATTEAEEKMLGGMRSTFDLLMSVLAREGLTPIETVGEPFDPEVHEAVMSNGDGDLVVSQELRRGYRLGDRVLRAALVALESN
jgi:molecular chaperone GrpE